MRIDVRRGRVLASAAGVVFALLGVTAIVLAVRGQQSPPRPPRAAASPIDVVPSTSSAHSSGAASSASSASPSKAESTPRVHGPILPASNPVGLRIPAIGVNSPIKPLGLDADHTVQTPPLSKDSYAGWYKYSPAPGSVGPSVLLGHVDSAAYGPAVFFRLGALRQGDDIYVTRADATIAEFRIERVVQYPKDSFPTVEVYGNIDHAGLRLITCGGTFDFATHNYEDNIVAYASLVSSHHVQGSS